MKQRWFTVACKWHQAWWGTGVEGLHVVTMESREDLMIKKCMPKLHGKMGVTDLMVADEGRYYLAELRVEQIC